MGDQLDLKRAKLSTKLNYLKRLMRKAKRDGARLADTSELRELQEQAASRANSIDSALRDDLFETSMEKESKFSKHYEKNKQAIAQLRSVIESHPMNSHFGSAGANSTADHLNELILSAEADLAIIDMESEILGYMARILTLDAMALADEVHQINYDGEKVPGFGDFRAPADGLELFLN